MESHDNVVLDSLFYNDNSFFVFTFYILQKQLKNACTKKGNILLLHLEFFFKNSQIVPLFMIFFLLIDCQTLI
jgi:hypothetical protein